MPYSPKPPLGVLKEIFNILNDVVAITHLSNSVATSHSQLKINSKLWIEFALSISNDPSVDTQYYPCTHFCTLLNEVLDHEVLDDTYLLNLKQLAKKSGRILEFANILNHLSKYDDGLCWISNDMVFQVVFHALQLNKKKFNHSSFKALCNLISYKVCLINASQLQRLKLLAYLNDRLHCFIWLFKFRSALYKDLSILEPQKPINQGMFVDCLQESHDANKRPLALALSSDEFDSEEEPSKRHKSQA